MRQSSPRVEKADWQEAADAEAAKKVVEDLLLDEQMSLLASCRGASAREAAAEAPAVLPLKLRIKLKRSLHALLSLQDISF